jgi:phosphate-selective porin OprO/OprP
VGRFKQPFSLEELTSVQGIDFMERSYGNQMVASNRNGVMLHGASIKGMTYAVSAYQDGFNELTNTNQVGTLGAARITSNLAELGGISDTVIHLGAAVDMGKYEVIPTTSTDSGSAASSVTRATVLSFRTENRGLANAYRAQIAGGTVTAGYGVQGNDAADISKNLKGIELALATGPFKFQTEYFDSRYSATSLNYCVVAGTTTCSPGSYGTSIYDLRAKAAYYELVYNLTGESWVNSYKSGAFTSIKPKANFSLEHGGGWGTWQLALRYSNYSVDEPSSFTRSADSSSGVSTGSSTIGNVSGWTNRVENAESANTWTLGLNWLLNPNTRIMLNYADTHFGRPVYYLTTSVPSSLGSTSREQVISVRTQLNF